MPHKDRAERAAYLVAYRDRTRVSRREDRRMSDRAHHANVRAARYGAEGRVTTAEIRGVMSAGSCAYCGATERLGIDHVRPLHEGGSNRPDNLVCCCHPCNISKFRQDRPGRWSCNHDACVECDTTEIRHLAHGLCSKCHRRKRTAAPIVAELRGARPDDEELR